MTAQTISQPTKANMLRRTLQTDATFSGLSGLLFILGAKPLVSFLGVGMPLILAVIGVNLLFYALILLYTASRENIDPRQVWVLIGLDMAWVLGSALIWLTGWPSFTTGGMWAMVIVADVVLLFALFKFLGLRRV